MNTRNIIIIVIGAVVAFGAVFVTLQFLNNSPEDDNTEIAQDDDSDNSDDSGNDNNGTNNNAQQTAEADKDTGNANSAGPGPIRSSRSDPMLASQLQEAARQINATGGMRIDQYTMMTGAEARGNRIRYRYEISRDLSEAQLTTFENFARRTNQETLCSRDDTRQLLNMGGEIEYAYFGPQNRYLFTTEITRC